MFESYTYENLLEEVLDNAPDDIDTRPGSIFYDAVSGILLKVAKLYTDLELIFTLSQVGTATGEYLDVKASEYGITRKEATKARYTAVIVGTVPDEGERFFYNGLYFIFTDGAYFEAEESGSEYNNVPKGSKAIPVDTIEGLTSATFGSVVEYATDTESDDSLRLRLETKISSAGENGNKQHYKNWCESISGVGLARIFPLWNGPNTVKAVLISTDGTSCSNELVEKVQEYIDPADKGYTATVDSYTYTVGDGLGEGAANIGAHFTAVAAFEEYINIAVDGIEIADGYEVADVERTIRTSIEEYFKTLSLTTEGTIKILSSQLETIISNTEGVLDRGEVSLNQGRQITVDELSIPTLQNIAF